MKQRILILEQIEKAIQLMDQLTGLDCECDKANPGGYCPQCGCHEKAVNAMRKAHKLVAEEP